MKKPINIKFFLIIVSIFYSTVLPSSNLLDTKKIWDAWQKFFERDIKNPETIRMITGPKTGKVEVEIIFPSRIENFVAFTTINNCFFEKAQYPKQNNDKNQENRYINLDKIGCDLCLYKDCYSKTSGDFNHWVATAYKGVENLLVQSYAYGKISTVKEFIIALLTQNSLSCMIQCTQSSKDSSTNNISTLILCPITLCLFDGNASIKIENYSLFFRKTKKEIFKTDVLYLTQETFLPPGHLFQYKRPDKPWDEHFETIPPQEGKNTLSGDFKLLNRFDLNFTPYALSKYYERHFDTDLWEKWGKYAVKKGIQNIFLIDGAIKDNPSTTLLYYLPNFNETLLEELQLSIKTRQIKMDFSSLPTLLLGIPTEIIQPLSNNIRPKNYKITDNDLAIILKKESSLRSDDGYNHQKNLTLQLILNENAFCMSDTPDQNGSTLSAICLENGQFSLEERFFISNLRVLPSGALYIAKDACTMKTENLLSFLTAPFL